MTRSLRCSVPFALALLSSAVFAAPQNLTVISFGGATKQAQERPTSSHSMPAVRAPWWQASTTASCRKSRPWSTSATPAGMWSRSKALSCCAAVMKACSKLDPQRFGDQANFVPGTFTECGVATYVWSMVMAYDHAKLAKGRPHGRTSGT